MSNTSLKFPKDYGKAKQHPRQNIREKGKFIWEQAVLHIILFCIKTFAFMLTCAEIQFKGYLREIESDRLININPKLRIRKLT